jgi:hypothetical protein
LALQKEIIDFTLKFLYIRNIKDLLRSVKNVVPKLLGFKNCNMYIYDPVKENLKAMTIDED